MSYCQIHGQYTGDGCPTCRDVESEIIDGLARSREDLAEAAAFIANAQNNPGEYVCPSCRFRTLRTGASRCPKCHADIRHNYWAEIEAAERAQRIAAAEKWERERPAREAKEAKDRARAEAEKFRDNLNKTIIGIGVAVWVYQLIDIWLHDSMHPQGNGLAWLVTGAIGIVNLAIGGLVMGVIIGFVVWAVVTFVNFAFDNIHSP